MVHLPVVLHAIILDYAAEWELVSWVDETWLSWSKLARNPRAGDLMVKNPRYARWGKASGNPSCWFHLRNHLPSLINFGDLGSSTCPEAVAYAIEHWDDTDTVDLLRNPLAIDWIFTQPESIRAYINSIIGNPAAGGLLAELGILKTLPQLGRISNDMHTLCRNPAPWAMAIVAANIGLVRPCHGLATNPSAINMVLNNVQLISWDDFSANTHPRAIEYLIANPSCIHWPAFSANPSAIAFLRTNFQKVDYKGLSANSGIFELKQPNGVTELLGGVSW